jgi:hypothetical protein
MYQILVYSKENKLMRPPKVFREKLAADKERERLESLFPDNRVILRQSASGRGRASGRR